jgi:hypothetical protein
MTAPAVARLSGPGEIVAVLPSLCGFPPQESLVLLSLRGPRRRLGLTARVDLPDPPDEDGLAVLCADRMTTDGASCVVVVVVSEHGRRDGLVRAVRTSLAARDVGVLEALHVAEGRWTSYTCRSSCCPAEGTPVPAAPPVLGLVQAEQVATGRAVLPSRDDLVRSLAAPTLLAAVAAEQRLEQAAQAELRSRAEHGVVAARRSTLSHVQALLDRVAAGTPLGAADAAALAVGLGDLQARDAVATLILTREEELLSLLVQAARQVVPPEDAAVCTLLAWTAYARGEGALANVALDRALAGRPDYSLALLLRTCLDAGIRPEEVRSLARGTEQVLRTHPGGRRGGRRARRPG